MDEDIVYKTVKYKFNEEYNAKTGKFKENIVGFNELQSLVEVKPL